MNSYFIIGFLVFYSTFCFYYALNRYTSLFRNLSAWELTEIFLSYTGFIQAVILAALFILWIRLTKWFLKQRYSIPAALVSGVVFGATLSFLLAMFFSRASGKQVETSLLFYLPLVTYGSLFGVCASLKERRRFDAQL